MKVSVIATVRNEAPTIANLLASLQAQTRPPDEIVITDGGSTDGAWQLLEQTAHKAASVRAAVRVIVRAIHAPGSNIAQGRNKAVEAATGDVIAVTDAGVRLAPDWLAQLVGPFSADEARPDVVSGFFVADPQSVFETAMGASVLPQLADINPSTFLPSSRSVAFTKAAWQRAGGYPQWLDYCEDLVFDLALKRAGCRFTFAPSAIAYFRPRSSLRAFFGQYFRYARGDGKADLWRKRHAIRYLTYIAAPLALALGFRYHLLWVALALAALAYCRRPWQRLWPSLGAWRIPDRLWAIALVPLIRVVGDLAKMIGYPVGVWWRLRRRPEEGARVARS
jgi:cellulose synthase/poly-beta-1,6-N-acetylglucosamine synthase-like glycosyltransferase